ncbi:hypothetical protein [Stenotrophomonas maltophilia]|uniref:hypothetical protein n=1 Tax=Stenotrophomonas maltophilia TaxID=40324 RepID=UPI0034545C47
MSTVAQTMEDMQEEIARLRAELQNAAKAALDAVALSCAKEREADALRAEAEALRKDAGRWQHARKLLSVDDIAERQRTIEEWNFLISEDECKRADEAIDTAMGASA